MNKSILVSISIFLTINIFSQSSFDYGFCKFDFKNYENVNPEFKYLDSIVEIDKRALNHSVKRLTGCFYSNISFEKGQIIKEGSKFVYPNFKKYYNKRSDDPNNFLYNLPSYELIYKYDNPAIAEIYYFNIYLDNTGETLEQTEFLHSDGISCKLINPEQAEATVSSRWKNDKSDIYVRFGYFGKKNCFAWIISRSIKGDKGYLGEMQTFIVDAVNGKIIYRKKGKLLYE